MDTLKKIARRAITIFIVVFLVSAAIITLVPPCILIALMPYGACVSVNWLAIFVMALVWSALIALAVAFILHWRGH